VWRTVPEWLETSLPLIEFALQGKQVRRMRHSFRTQLRSYEEGPRVVNAGYAAPTLRTMATSCRTISAHAEWEGHGETITRRIFKPFTGGAMWKRDQGEFRPIDEDYVHKLGICEENRFLWRYVARCRPSFERILLSVVFLSLHLPIILPLRL